MKKKWPRILFLTQKRDCPQTNDTSKYAGCAQLHAGWRFLSNTLWSKDSVV